MSLRILCLLLFSLANTIAATAQTTKTQTQSSEVHSIEEEEEIDEEEVIGLWELSAYLAKKLADEIGSRMNLEDSEKPVEGQRKKRVKIKVGPIKLERIESQ